MAGSLRGRPRIEPRLDETTPQGPETLDLRLGAEDRAAASSSEDGRRRRRPPPREEDDSFEDAEFEDIAPEPRVSGGKDARRRRPAAVSSERKRRKPKAKRGRRGGGNGGRRSLLGRMVRFALIVGIWAFVAVAGVLAYYATTLPTTAALAVPKRPPNIKILAADGTLIGNRGDTGGEALGLDEMPDYLPKAVLAIEDRRFYSHFGVDPLGLARAAYANLRAGNVVQGGSTITQQLAKNLFLTPDRTLERKIQEVVLSLWLEARYSKDQILEMYLNRVYLGAGAYGVDAAARRYFGKSAANLSLKEAATIAGLLKAPSRYAPTTNPDAADARANVVLGAMLAAGFINGTEEKQALADRVRTKGEDSNGAGNYVADWVADVLPDVVGALDQDVIVDTTIDPTLQAAAAKAVSDGLAKNGAKAGVDQGALVAIESTGAVRALVGGRSYEKSQFNRATEAKRQPGSSFKPFVYLTALEFGLVPETVRVDQPIRIGKWEPKNYAKDYKGPVTLQTALALSINTVAAELANEVGPERVVETAHRLGIASPLQANPSIALGTSEVTLLELTGAYTPFSNGGFSIPPYVVSRVRGIDGKVLYQRPAETAPRIVDPTMVGMMNGMMADTLARGTARKAHIDGWDAAGKTGTSNDFRDAWFIGYTAHMTTGVWLGNDDSKPTKRVTGGGLPAEIWNGFMAAAHQGVTPVKLPGDYRFRDPDTFDAIAAPSQEIRPPADVGAGDVVAARPPSARDSGAADETAMGDPVEGDRRYLDAPPPRADSRRDAFDEPARPARRDEPLYDEWGYPVDPPPLRERMARDRRYAEERPRYDDRAAEDRWPQQAVPLPPADVGDDYYYERRPRRPLLDRLFGGW